MKGFNALVRFEIEGKPYYGNLVETTDVGFQVTKLTGSLVEGFIPDGTKVYTVAKVRENISLVTKDTLDYFAFDKS